MSWRAFNAWYAMLWVVVIVVMAAAPYAINWWYLR